MKDINFGYHQVLARDSKGEKYRITMLPQKIIPEYALATELHRSTQKMIKIEFFSVKFRVILWLYAYFGIDRGEKMGRHGSKIWVGFLPLKKSRF